MFSDRGSLDNCLLGLLLQHQNLETVKIKQCMEKFRKQFEKVSVDMCIICIMSHGSNGKIVDIYGEDMDVEKDVIENFNECHALSGKPKLFLLQYCRGEDIDFGVTRVSLSLDDIDESSCLFFDQNLMEILEEEEVILEDILIANSTVPGFVSNRNTRHGSWFFQCLTQVIKEKAEHLDIREIFDEVSNRMNDKESNDNYRRKQTFETINRGFHKKLYFNPVHKDNFPGKDNEQNELSDEEGDNNNDHYNEQDVDKDKTEASSKQLGIRKKITSDRKAFCKCNLF